MRTHYNRAMSILEKIKNDPGMTVDEILNKFTRWEREEIYPPIYSLNVSLMIDEMATVNCIELSRREGLSQESPNLKKDILLN
jgi:hypothetical protein